MSHGKTRYAVSSRFIAWGESLAHQRLADLMGLDQNCINTQGKGDVITSPASSRSRTAKTGMLSASYDSDENRFDPAAQLIGIADSLDGLSKETLRDCGVERAEVQVFLYYEKGNPSEAEPDFLSPERFIVVLAKTGISLRLSAMP